MSACVCLSYTIYKAFDMYIYIYIYIDHRASACVCLSYISHIMYVFMHIILCGPVENRVGGFLRLWENVSLSVCAFTHACKQAL